MENKNTREEWDKIWTEEGYHTWRTYPCTFTRICELIPENANVLELGCGVGNLTYMMWERGHEVLPLDISPVAIECMRMIYNIEGTVATLPPIPEGVKNIDVVVASQFLEHMEDPNIILKEMTRVANMAIIAVPNFVLPPDECEYHHQTFTVPTIKDLLFNYYNHVEVYTTTDIFMQNKQTRIVIPVIICKCWGVKK